jgi:hypothetical protein
MLKCSDMKKIPPAKIARKECSDLLAYSMFRSAKYAGKTDAQLERMFAEERKEEQRRKRASEGTGEPNSLA